MFFQRLRPFAAPKRYVFKDPDTGFEYEEKNTRELVQRIVRYRAQNMLPPIERLDLVLENFWCSQAENLGECEYCDMKKLHRGLWQYIKGGIALVTSLVYHHQVSQDEADARASQCALCKYNTFPDKDMFVEWSDRIADASVGDRRTKHHDALGNCEVCTCTLKAKVFYKGDMGLTEEQITRMQEVKCWQIEADRKYKQQVYQETIKNETKA